MTGREGGAQSRGAGGRGGFPGGGGGAGVRFIWLPCRTGTATQPPLMTLCKRYLGIRKCPPPKERYQNFNRLLGSGRGHAVFYTKNIQDWKVETILPTMLRIKPLGRRIKITMMIVSNCRVWYDFVCWCLCLIHSLTFGMTQWQIVILWYLCEVMVLLRYNMRRCNTRNDASLIKCMCVLSNQPTNQWEYPENWDF